MKTCTWAPTVFQGTQVTGPAGGGKPPTGEALRALAAGYTAKLEDLGISHLLIAQRWWGSGEEIEASSLDCLAMTSTFAAHSHCLQLVTAIHPGFFQPTAIAKWGATMHALTSGRWHINVVSGWNMEEFDMYGIDPLDHDTRYARSAEFIEVLRGAWTERPFSYEGQYYRASDLRLEPQPESPLQIFQGGQSEAAIAMAGKHSDWMFMNGGSPEKVERIMRRAQAAAAPHGRQLKFALYAAPLCRPTDAEAWAEINARIERIDPAMASRRRQRVGSAQGMWAEEDALSMLDTNEGYMSGLIGSPDTVMARINEFRELGVEMLHLDLGDKLFVDEVLPHI